MTIFSDLIPCPKKPPFLTMIYEGKLTASIKREALHLKLRLLPSNRHFITLLDSSKETAKPDSIDVFNLSLQIVSPRTHSTRKSGAYSGDARSNNHPISLCLCCIGNEHFCDPITIRICTYSINILVRRRVAHNPCLLCRISIRKKVSVNIIAVEINYFLNERRVKFDVVFCFILYNNSHVL